jgi:hypothetical protein
MLSHFALVATLAASMDATTTDLPAQALSVRSSGTACLSPDSPDMRGLVARLRVTLSSNGRGPAGIRDRHFNGRKFSPEAIVPIREEQVCAKAVRLLRAHLSEVEWTAGEAAVVRVDGRYIVNFRYRASGFPQEVPATFYFNRGFTKVVATTLS